MDATGGGTGPHLAERLELLSMLVILLNSIQDSVCKLDELPRLRDEVISLAAITCSSGVWYIDFGLFNEGAQTRRDERFLLDETLFLRAFAKLMAPNWSNVDNDEIPVTFSKRRKDVYQTFMSFIKSTASDEKYRPLYLEHLEDIIKFCSNPQSSFNCYEAIFAMLADKNKSLVLHHKPQVLQCLSSECHKLIDIHKAHPRYRVNIGFKLREIYELLLKCSAEDRKILFPAGQRLRAYLYQNKIMDTVATLEDENNAFIYRPSTTEEAVAILSVDSNSYKFEDGSEGYKPLDVSCPRFREGYITCNIPGVPGRLYITVNDTNFPENFLGIGGLEDSRVSSIECWQQLLKRDYASAPFSLIKPSFLLTVIAGLGPLRARAESELKQFILGCNLREVRDIYKTIFDLSEPSEQDEQKMWIDNRRFLTELFKSDLEQRGLYAASNGSNNQKDYSEEILSIIRAASKATDKGSSVLSRGSGVLVSEKTKITPPKGKGREQSSPVIWIGLGIAIVATLVYWWLHSGHSPFKVLGTSKSMLPLPPGSSSLIPK